MTTPVELGDVCFHSASRITLGQDKIMIRPKKQILISAGIILFLGLYPLCYLVQLETFSVGGGGSAQRIPTFKNPLTGKLVDNPKALMNVYKPMLKLDKKIRPKFWISYSDNSLELD